MVEPCEKKKGGWKSTGRKTKCSRRGGGRSLVVRFQKKESDRGTDKVKKRRERDSASLPDISCPGRGLCAVCRAKTERFREPNCAPPSAHTGEHARRVTASNRLCDDQRCECVCQYEESMCTVCVCVCTHVHNLECLCMFLSFKHCCMLCLVDTMNA